jgi:hypothetical protein
MEQLTVAANAEFTQRPAQVSADEYEQKKLLELGRSWRK